MQLNASIRRAYLCIKYVYMYSYVCLCLLSSLSAYGWMRMLSPCMWTGVCNVFVHAVKVPVCVDACIQCVSVRARPAAARVTLVNIKAASCFAELTNLSHPTPRAAFETHTAGLHSALWAPSISTSPTLRFLVSNYTPVKYLLISSLAISPYLTLFLILHSWIHFHEATCWRSEHNCRKTESHQTAQVSHLFPILPTSPLS